MKDKKIYTSKEQALEDLKRKYNSGLYRGSAKRKLRMMILQRQLEENPVTTSLSQIEFQQQQAQQRQKLMGSVMNRCEQIECMMLNINEVPFLHSLERERANLCTPNDISFSKLISDATNICSPDNQKLKFRDWFDARNLPD